LEKPHVSLNLKKRGLKKTAKILATHIPFEPLLEKKPLLKAPSWPNLPKRFWKKSSRPPRNRVYLLKPLFSKLSLPLIKPGNPQWKELPPGGNFNLGIPMKIVSNYVPKEANLTIHPGYLEQNPYGMRPLKSHLKYG